MKYKTEKLSTLKKLFSKALPVFMVASLLLTGCSGSSSEGEEDSNDFSAAMELKVPDPPAGEMPSILFVGNSHTYYNSLPDMVFQLAESNGRSADIYELSEGAYRLEYFADTEDELGAVLDEALTEMSWDFVILQENTNAAVSNSDEDMYPYARTLNEKILDAGAQTGFLMTWAPKEGLDTGLFQMDCQEIQSMISEHYVTISEELDSLLIPGGVAFMRCLEEHPEIELWDEDGQHASVAGTYLAACTAYAVIFQESPEGFSYTAELDEETAKALQAVAAGFLAK